MTPATECGFRTVIVPFHIPPPLRAALLDIRSAANALIPEWRRHPEDPMFDLTKRAYWWAKDRYPHLASGWYHTIARETRATLRAWDKQLRRLKRLDVERWERMSRQTPRRVRLKAALQSNLYRLHGRTLDVTIHPDRHVSIDLGNVANPLFEKYGAASDWIFGLTVTDRLLVFQFRIPWSQPRVPESVGADVNMPSVEFAGSDGTIGSVDLRPVTRVQAAMERKRRSIDATIPTDLRLQRRVKRRYHQRERNRVTSLMHLAANEFLEKVGERNIVLEDLSETQDELLPSTLGRDARRKLSVWTQGQFQRIVAYKARTQVVHVDPRGTSSNCPRCGARLEHPEWRRSVCATCQGDWHRDRAAAVSILNRGSVALWGARVPPNALNALLELSRWDPNRIPSAGNERRRSELDGPPLTV